MKFRRRTLFEFINYDKNNNGDNTENEVEKYVEVICLKTLREEILGTDGEFYAIIEGRRMKLPKQTAQILQESEIVEVIS